MGRERWQSFCFVSKQFITSVDSGMRSSSRFTLSLRSSFWLHVGTMCGSSTLDTWNGFTQRWRSGYSTTRSDLDGSSSSTSPVKKPRGQKAASPEQLTCNASVRIPSNRMLHRVQLQRPPRSICLPIFPPIQLLGISSFHSRSIRCFQRHRCTTYPDSPPPDTLRSHEENCQLSCRRSEDFDGLRRRTVGSSTSRRSIR
jgi:hypothetical protein